LQFPIDQAMLGFVAIPQEVVDKEMFTRELLEKS